jgi:hypothetical protein
VRHKNQELLAACAAFTLLAVGLALVACGGKKKEPVEPAKAPEAAREIVTPPAPAEPAAYQVVDATVGWGVLGVNKSIKGNTLVIGGKAYASGLGTHAPSRVNISFPATFKTLTGFCGVDEEDGASGTVVFRVLDKEKVLFESPVVRGGTPALPFSVNVEGLSSLTLVVEDGGDGFAFDHGDWVDLKLQ